MSRTAIGWPVLQPDELATCHVLVRDMTVVLRVRPGDTCDILMDLVRRFDATVEPLDLPGERDEWSYALRKVRQSSDIWSEHSAGTAVDLNATRHPRGSRDTFTPRQRQAIDRLLDFYEGAVAWGGRFRSVPDDMHFEITVPPGSALLKRVARKVRDSMPEEDDMPTADEVADALWRKFATQAFTGDEAGTDLDKRAPFGVQLVAARASLKVLEAVEALSRQNVALAAAVADDATRAQVQAVADQIAQLAATLQPGPTS